MDEATTAYLKELLNSGWRETSTARIFPGLGPYDAVFFMSHTTQGLEFVHLDIPVLALRKTGEWFISTHTERKLWLAELLHTPPVHRLHPTPQAAVAAWKVSK